MKWRINTRDRIFPLHSQIHISFWKVLEMFSLFWELLMSLISVLWPLDDEVLWCGWLHHWSWRYGISAGCHQDHKHWIWTSSSMVCQSSWPCSHGNRTLTSWFLDPWSNGYLGVDGERAVLKCCWRWITVYVLRNLDEIFQLKSKM